MSIEMQRAINGRSCAELGTNPILLHKYKWLRVRRSH
jgi:hypothetical protein